MVLRFQTTKKSSLFSSLFSRELVYIYPRDHSRDCSHELINVVEPSSVRAAALRQGLHNPGTRPHALEIWPFSPLSNRVKFVNLAG